MKAAFIHTGAHFSDSDRVPHLPNVEKGLIPADLDEGILTWSEGDQQQKTANDAESLEEIILEEVIHRSRRVEHPESIEVSVHGCEPEDEYHRAQLRLITYNKHATVYKPHTKVCMNLPHEPDA